MCTKCNHKTAGKIKIFRKHVLSLLTWHDILNRNAFCFVECIVATCSPPLLSFLFFVLNNSYLISLKEIVFLGEFWINSAATLVAMLDFQRAFPPNYLSCVFVVVVVYWTWQCHQFFHKCTMRTELTGNSVLWSDGSERTEQKLPTSWALCQDQNIKKTLVRSIKKK